MIFITFITVNNSYYVKSNIVNFLLLIISEADGYIKEKNGSKYLVFDLMNENNKVLKNVMNFGIGFKMRLRP